MDEKQRTDIIKAHQQAAAKLRAGAHDEKRHQSLLVRDYLVLAEAAAQSVAPSPAGQIGPGQAGGGEKKA